MKVGQKLLSNNSIGNPWGNLSAINTRNNLVEARVRRRRGRGGLSELLLKEVKVMVCQFI